MLSGADLGTERLLKEQVQTGTSQDGICAIKCTERRVELSIHQTGLSAGHIRDRIRFRYSSKTEERFRLSIRFEEGEMTGISMPIPVLACRHRHDEGVLSLPMRTRLIGEIVLGVALFNTLDFRSSGTTRTRGRTRTTSFTKRSGSTARGRTSSGSSTPVVTFTTTHLARGRTPPFGTLFHVDQLRFRRRRRNR